MKPDSAAPRVLVGAPELPRGRAGVHLRGLVSALSKSHVVDLCAGGVGIGPEGLLAALKSRIAARSYRAVLVVDSPQSRPVVEQVAAFAGRVPVVVVALPGVAPGSPLSRRRALGRPPAQAWRFGANGDDDGLGELLPLSVHRAPRPTSGWVSAKLAALAAPAERPGGRASVVIPCWNGLEYTKDCLRAVLSRTDGDFEVIVVDNGSVDGTPRFVKSLRDPRVTLIRNKTNLGFAKAMNQGLRRARGRYAVWLNSDVVVADGWLDRMIAALERAPWIGAVGPYSNKTSGLQLAPAAPRGGAKDLPAFAAAWGLSRAGRLAWTHRLTGFCLAHRRSVLDEIGYLDERFGLGCYEDFDFCLRLRQAGYELFIAEDVYVFHHEHKTFDRNRVAFHEHSARNRAVFIDKWCRHYLSALDELDAVLEPSRRS